MTYTHVGSNKEQYMLLVIRDLGSTKKKGSLESVVFVFGNILLHAVLPEQEQ